MLKKLWNSLMRSYINIQNQPFQFQMILKTYAICVFVDILKESHFAFSLEELAKEACERNNYVKSYLLANGNKNK